MPQDEAQRHAQEWHLRELEELGEVSYLPEQVTTLGAETGCTAEMRRQFLEKTAVVKTMLRKLPAIQDTQVELVLQNACLSISKVAHLLRANGTELADAGSTDALEAFDSAQRESLSRLAPGITARGLEQAGLPYAMGVWLWLALRQWPQGLTWPLSLKPDQR